MPLVSFYCFAIQENRAIMYIEFFFVIPSKGWVSDERDKISIWSKNH